MPSPDLLLRAHPALGWWTVVWAAVVVVLLLRGRAVDGRAFAGLALGALTLVAVAPPRGGLVPGIARTCDVRAEHLLWPWAWATQDPRMGLVALTLVAGVAVARRPAWLTGAAVLPLALEGVQLAVPSLARACSVPDLLHAWMGLGVGAVLGLTGRTLVRRLGSARRAGVCVALAAAVVVGAGWTWDTTVVDPHTRVVLRGETVTFPAVHTPAVDGQGAPYPDMASTALRDLRAAGVPGETPGGGLPHAGPAEQWGYFWPRDGAFLAVALTRTGHELEAVRLLEGTAGLYLDPMYGFDARYLLSGERVSADPRRAQVDGCGWVLWAIHETAGSGVALPDPVSGLRDRCTDQLLRATGGGSHLPAPGQDYWERTTYEHLLGASAPVAAGLRFAAADYRALGQAARAEQVEVAAAGVRGEIERRFAPGYLRAGTRGGVDAATAMLMPPFDPDPMPGVRDAWLAYQEEAARPAGGLAPGAGWKQDGISWTPEVALVAYTAAAAGEDAIAHHWLDWLDRHRAPWGSLPEKVDSAGRPGGPAPLVWTSALVVLTLDELADALP